MGLTIIEPASLIFDLNQIQPVVCKLQKLVCAAGRHQFTMCNLALLMGGNTRVGREDNFYLEKGAMATSSGQQVEKIVRIAKEHGLEPATPEEARQVLNLKGLEMVKY